MNMNKQHIGSLSLFKNKLKLNLNTLAKSFVPLLLISSLSAVTFSNPDLRGRQMHNVGDPTSPQDVATKAYVDRKSTNLDGVTVTNGHIGLGTTSPQTPLHIVGSSGSITLEGDSTTTGAPKIIFKDQKDGGSESILSYDKTNGLNVNTQLKVNGLKVGSHGYSYHRFELGGSSGKYYPITIFPANNAKMYNIEVSRHYNWKAPKHDSNWNNSASHFGGMTLNLDFIGSSWGGTAGYGKVKFYGQTYTTVVGNLGRSCHGMCIVVWLKGGGVTYDIMSNQANLAAPKICTSNNCLIYDNSNDNYDKWATSISVGSEQKPKTGDSF